MRAIRTSSRSATGLELDLPFRVLLEVPKALHIPVFALGVEAKRHALENTASTGLEVLKKVVSGNTARAVDSGRYGPYLLMHTRQRRGRTALYSTWLAFPEREPAEAFARDYPRLGLDTIQATTEQGITQREAQVRHGAATGRYNLGPLQHQTRLSRAREVVRLTEEQETLGYDLGAIRMLRAGLADAQDVVSIG